MNVASTVPAGAAPSLSAAGVIANAVAFQAGWFACVLGAAHGWPWAGTAFAAVIVAWHLRTAARPGAELALVAAAVLVGALWDSLLIRIGWISFSAGTLVEGYAPHWILALWALFATTLNASLNWLKGRWLVAMLLGAVCGPLAYWGGARLGALALVEPNAAMAALAAGWALMTPALVALARRCDGMRVVR